MSTAVDLFLSLDITRHNRELRGLVLGSPDQARDENGRWTRIEGNMDEAKHHAEKALRLPQPAGSNEKDLEKAHATVADATHEAAIRGTAESHTAAMEAAKAASGKFARLSEAHGKASNSIEANAAKRASEDYRAIAADHKRAACLGGDSQPHVGYVAPKAAPAPAAPETASPTMNAFAAMEKAASRGRDPQEAYRKAYPGFSADAEEAMDKARTLSARVKEDVEGIHTRKDDSTERMEHMVNAHKVAADALRAAAAAMPENSRRGKKSLRDAEWHDNEGKKADAQLQERRKEDAADGYTPKPPAVPPGDAGALLQYYNAKKDEGREMERRIAEGLRKSRRHPALSSE